MARKAKLGPISAGTLRATDLLCAFSNELESIVEGQRYKRLIRGARSVDPDSDLGQRILEDLQQALGEFAPPYCYFGAHPGDEADFGYWPDWTAIEADRRDGSLRAGGDLPADGSSTREYLHISDHGNAELYTWDSAIRRWRSIWGVV